MGKGAPAAPNPVTTANAQTASNQQTALTQAQLGMVNNTDAMGNTQTYNQIGAWSDGTPRFETKTTLSAPNQQLLQSGQATQQNLANLAQEQSGRLSGLLNAPLDWSAQQTFLNDITDSNLNSQWDRMAENNETSLINRGIRPGSAQYTQAQDDFSRSRSSAYNDARLNNFNSALQSQLALRQAPLNELAALSGGSQIQSPSFAATSQTPVAGTDVAGITNSAYQNNLARYNQGQQTLGGLFSAGASLIPLLSDRRMKTDIHRIGTADNGLPIHCYRYLGGDTYHIGFLADEVEEIHPQAVETGPDGFKRVHYNKAVL